MRRCSWVGSNPLSIAYHDQQWGVPLYDDRGLFAALSLEIAQAGLSWLTVLKKRDSYFQQFDQFNPELIAHYNEDKKHRLLNDATIIRHAGKINAIITNAQALLRLQQRQSFNHYVWQFVDGQPQQNRWTDASQVPVATRTAERMARQLKQDGFVFIGRVICYSFMQAVGLVNDHTLDCFAHSQCQRLSQDNTSD